jgi:hypothetical protein
MPEKDFPYTVQRAGKEFARASTHQAAREAGTQAVLDDMEDFVALLAERLAMDPVFRRQASIYLACHCATPQLNGGDLCKRLLGMSQPASGYSYTGPSNFGISFGITSHETILAALLK